MIRCCKTSFYPISLVIPLLPSFPSTRPPYLYQGVAPIGEGTEGGIVLASQRCLVIFEAGGVGGQSVCHYGEEGLQDSFLVAEAGGRGREGGKEGRRVRGTESG